MPDHTLKGIPGVKPYKDEWHVVYMRSTGEPMELEDMQRLEKLEKKTGMSEEEISQRYTFLCDDMHFYKKFPNPEHKKYIIDF